MITRDRSQVRDHWRKGARLASIYKRRLVRIAGIRARRLVPNLRKVRIEPRAGVVSQCRLVRERQQIGFRVGW
jgi:hypothetical protein